MNENQIQMSQSSKLMQCLQTGHWNSDLNYFGIENFIVSKRLFMILLIEWDLENGVEY